MFNTLLIDSLYIGLFIYFFTFYVNLSFFVMFNYILMNFNNSKFITLF